VRANEHFWRGSFRSVNIQLAKTGVIMAIQEGATERWTKSSYSAGNGACVEIKSPVPGMVSIRDSKDPEGPTLDFAPGPWAAFVTEVAAGGFGSV
jgi:Domain of unknown function (DUF397)